MLIRLLFFLVAVIVIPNASRADVEIVATVNTDVISSIDVMNYTKLLAILSNTELNEKNYDELFRRSLDKLIEGILFLYKAEELGLVIEESEVEERLGEALRGSTLLQRLNENGLEADLLRERIKMTILQDQVVINDIAPHITVNQKEIDDFKEQNTKKRVAFFELAKVQDGEKGYLGLFSAENINSDLLDVLEVTKVGEKTQGFSIRLLDKFGVTRDNIRNTFDIIQIKSNITENLKHIKTQKNISCNNTPSDIEGVTLEKVTNFSSDNSKGSNSIYRQLLSMRVNDMSSIINIGGEYSIVLLCGITKNIETDSEIQRNIFMHKVVIQTANYIKRLKLANVIRIYV